jgi:hypothetical protein
MPEVIVSNFVYEAVKTRALVSWEEDGEQTPDGQWKVPVSERLMGMLQRNKGPTETESEYLERMWRRTEA